MTTIDHRQPILATLDGATSRLVRLSAILAIGDEPTIRGEIGSAAEVVPAVWIEELILQCYLFCGFPRGLNAMREWRRVSPMPISVEDRAGEAEWRRRGEVTCRLVYGAMYDRLRVNIRGLHPELDDWMIVEGYGKVLSRPALDLPRRELCIVAACAASEQARQLHSHLHGALNVGVAPAALLSAVETLEGVVSPASLESTRLLARRVVAQATTRDA